MISNMLDWTNIFRYLLCLFWVNGGFLFAADFSDVEWEIVPTDEGVWSFNHETNIATAFYGVAININDPSSGGASIQADRITIDAEIGDILAEGNVSMHQNGVVWRGEEIRYNYITRILAAGAYRAGQSPFIASGTELYADPTAGNYRIGSAYVSTDDHEEPFLKVKMESVDIINQERFEAQGSTVYAGKVPLIRLPKLRGNLDRSSSQFNTTPGYRSRFGYFLLNEYNWQTSENLDTTFNFDYRTSRGFAGGPDFDYNLGPVWGSGELQAYYLNDRNTELDAQGNRITNDRFRFGWFHQAQINDQLTAKVSIQKMSDSLLNRDFFETFHRQNTQPKSYIELNQQWRNFALSALAQPRMNDFFNRVERIPEIKFTGLRQQIGVTPLFYESETSAGYFSREYMYDNLPDFDAARFDSFHQMLYPKNYFGWLNLTPRIGGRYSYYSSTTGTGTTLNEQTRFIFNTGTEASVKLSRVFPQYKSNIFDARGLKHVVVPSVNYVFVPEPNARPNSIPQFDYDMPSLRMLPIDFPAFNAIDAIDTSNVMRVGLRNQLQTKRGEDEIIENLVYWNLFADWRLHPEVGQDDFADMTSDINFRPRSWLNMGSQVRYSLEDEDYRLADQSITLTPNDTWSLQVGNIFIRDEPTYWGTGNNAYYTRFYYRLNENWGARINHHFEARDNRMEEQSYTVYRDFRSFTGALSLRMRNPRENQESDYTIALVISMKAFPRFDLNSDINRPTYLFDGN
ncbi:LPS assembly protein LptD [Verrucomicrobia bacterium]|nr:LPS assembly protein LptD [Verrucomicrobiota bacterium]